MTIAIDCRHLDFSGIGVYIRGCLPFFLDSENFFYLIGDREKLRPYIQNHKNSEVLQCCLKPFSINELFFFPGGILKKINSSDLFYSPFFNIPGGIKVPVYSTIHDIIFPDMPELISVTGLAARMWFYRRTFSKSRKIFTVSDFSKSRIEHYSGSKIPVVVTYSAIQSWIIQRKKSVNQKKNTIVFVGNIKKHKGLDCLLDAFISARNEGLPHKLVIIGEKENFRSSDNAIPGKIEAAGPDAVSFTGYISDELLAQHLSEASLLVQPSLYEGFGLPPLEAMVLGTHSLVSDIPVFREIYDGFPVTFFTAGDSTDLKNKMTEILLNKKPSSPVLSNELLYKYSFEKTARIILRELQ